MFRPCRLSRLVFLPVELLAEAEAAPEVAKAGVPLPVPAAPPNNTVALTSLLLLEPADMSLAGPVAEAMEIFSSSNSAGPKKNEIKPIMSAGNSSFCLSMHALKNLKFHSSDIRVLC